VHRSTIVRHLGLFLLLASFLAAQEQVRAVTPAHSPSISADSSRREWMPATISTSQAKDPAAQTARCRLHLARNSGRPSTMSKLFVESAGLTLDNVVYVHVYLTDIGGYSEMNRVFGEYFPKTPPARAVLGVSALPDPPVQINAVAVRNLDGRKAVYPANFPKGRVRFSGHAHA
jgi:hypothetical protein